MDNLSSFPDILDNPLIPIKLLITLCIVADFDGWPDVNFTFVRCDTSCHDVQERCFSRAVRSDYPKTITGNGQKVKVRYQPLAFIRLFNTLEFNHFFPKTGGSRFK